MFILRDDKPYFINQQLGKVFGVTIDAVTYTVDGSKSAPIPEDMGPIYNDFEICAVLGIYKQEILNKRTGKIEVSSTKSATSTLDGFTGVQAVATPPPAPAPAPTPAQTEGE
jgi:hypothetical protein